MKKIIYSILSVFRFVPFIQQVIDRDYLILKFGLFFTNVWNNKILKINRAPFLVHYTSKVQSSQNFVVEEGPQINKVYISLAASGGCYYQAYNGIRIGAGTIWAHGCKFISTNHSFKDYSTPTEVGPIVLGRNVWLGSNVVVLPEVSIGDNTIVGAGAVVTKSIPERSIAVGNPAKVIAKRCNKCLDKIPLSKEENWEEECSSCSMNRTTIEK